MNILITGGSSGLGRKIVETLSVNKNHEVFFTYNTHCDEAREIERSSKKNHAVKVDFCSEDDIANLIANMPAMDLDVLVNNVYAGAPQSTYFHKIKASDFQESFKKNVIPTIRVTQQAIEIFKKKKFGKIINIITDALDNPPMGYSIYVSNKAYIAELSKVWNTEYTRYNITSNCVSPAYMQTKFAQMDERFVEQMRLQHPLKQLLQPEEVARVVLFLIESSQQINGINININGGE